MFFLYSRHSHGSYFVALKSFDIQHFCILKVFCIVVYFVLAWECCGIFSGNFIVVQAKHNLMKKINVVAFFDEILVNNKKLIYSFWISRSKYLKKSNQIKIFKFLKNTRKNTEWRKPFTKIFQFPPFDQLNLSADIWKYCAILPWKILKLPWTIELSQFIPNWIQ